MIKREKTSGGIPGTNNIILVRKQNIEIQKELDLRINWKNKSGPSIHLLSKSVSEWQGLPVYSGFGSGSVPEQ